MHLWRPVVATALVVSLAVPAGDLAARGGGLAFGLARLGVPELGAQPADTTRVSTKPLFTANDLLVAGGFAVGTVAVSYADRYFATRLQDSTTQANRFLKNSATGFRVIGDPGALIIGATLYTVGRVGRYQRIADLGLHGEEAIVMAATATYLLKGAVGRARPYVVGDTNPRDFQFMRGFRKRAPYASFPSGHTTTGFAAAAAVTSETSRWWPHSRWYIGPVMYGGATLIGLSRMYNNKHWASDVLMGAAIGTFSGLKVVRYHHSHPNNRIDRWLLHASIVPTAVGPVVSWAINPR